MEKTFSGNLDLAMAYSRLEQLEAVWKKKGAVRYPSLNLKGSGARSRQPGIPDDITGNTHSLSLAANYEVDIWKKLQTAPGHALGPYPPEVPGILRASVAGPG